jgi:cytochrome c553
MPVRSVGLVAMILALPAALAASDTAPIAAAFDKDIKPLLSTYCYKCHGTEKQKGDIDFSIYAKGAAALGARKVWKLTSERLTAKEMPPEKEKQQPSDDERLKIIAWVQALKNSDPPDAGRVTIHRLNRAEYNNTVRDLIGMDLKPAGDFPEDDVGEGFDNIADVLAIPPLLMEKYIIAADQILDKATVTEQIAFHVDAEQWPVVQDGKERPRAEADAGKTDPGKTDGAKPGDKKPKAVRLDAASEIRGVIAFPESGKYTFKIKAWGEQAGNEPVDLAIKIDDKMVKEVKVTAQKSGPGTYSVVVDAKRGMRPVALAFVNPYEDAPAEPPAADPAKDPKDAKKAAPIPPKPPAAAPPRPGAAKGGPRVRAVDIETLDIAGAPPHSVPDSHRRIFFIRPDARVAKREAARQIVERFATRAYRRPVDAERVERLLKLFDVADQQGEVFEEAVRLSLKGVLISPSFLFRVEQDRAPDANGAYRLDDYEIASRLSYFLWSSMPDDELFEAAKQGRLKDQAEIDKQVARMLKDPRSRALVENFASQWLQLRKLNYIEPDPAKFPEFTKELRKALYDEVAAYFENVMREDRSVLDFLDSDYAFLNDKLAKHYGLPAVPGANLRKVALPDHTRGGVLTMGGVLAITSLPNRTSPVKRGKWVLEQLLGDPPPPPPPVVPSLEKQDEAQTGKKLSLRAKLEAHRADAVCASCHQRMDPIGFGLENFDAIGRWREMDGGEALDTGGKLPSGQQFHGPVELKAIFMGRKEQFVKCLTEKLMTYALGRGVEPGDDPTVEKIGKALEQNQYRFSVLVGEIARSYPFLNRKVH